VISFQFVAENFDELEADFQREYGIDLREALYGDNPIGGRRLTALINGLSPSSLTALKNGGTGGQVWGNTEELLATLCELVDRMNYMYHQIHFKPPHPQHLEIPRPYERVPAPVKAAGANVTEELQSLIWRDEALGNVVWTPPDASSSEREGD
jgi:hypothetical protein